jgi:hypothetical protein
MDKMYNQNFVGKNDPNFQYDKQVDFSKVKKVDASWDEGQEDIQEYYEED